MQTYFKEVQSQIIIIRFISVA